MARSPRITIPTREGEWDNVRAATQRGRVIAREEFQKQVEAKVGRRLVGETRGRRKKKHPGTHENVLWSYPDISDTLLGDRLTASNSAGLR